jgi:hypothetical protein
MCSVYTLQGFRYIATKFIATTIFRCNKIWYYHKIHVRGNRIRILPQFSFVALSALFVAVEAMYYNKPNHRRNSVMFLRQLRCVASIGHFVAIETTYCNKINVCGNIWKDIARTLACCINNHYCCKKWLCIATKYVLVVIAQFWPQFHYVAITITYCNKSCIHGNMYNILQQPLLLRERNKIPLQIFIIHFLRITLKGFTSLSHFVAGTSGARLVPKKNLL